MTPRQGIQDLRRRHNNLSFSRFRHPSSAIPARTRMCDRKDTTKPPRQRRLKKPPAVAGYTQSRSSSTIIRSMFVSCSAILTNASANGSEIVCFAQHAKGGLNQARLIGQEQPLPLFGRRFFRRRHLRSFVRRRERRRRRWQGRDRDVPRSPPTPQCGWAGDGFRLGANRGLTRAEPIRPSAAFRCPALSRRMSSPVSEDGQLGGTERVRRAACGRPFQRRGERSARCGQPHMRNCNFLFAPCAQMLGAPTRTRRRCGQASSGAD